MDTINQPKVSEEVTNSNRNQRIFFNVVFVIAILILIPTIVGFAACLKNI